MTRFGSLFKFRTSLKLPMRLAEMFSSLRLTRPSRPIPIVSILFLAKLSSVNWLRLWMPSICSIRFSSIQSFSRLMHLSMQRIRRILLVLRKSYLSIGSLSSCLIVSISLQVSHIFCRKRHFSSPSISVTPWLTMWSSARLGKFISQSIL